MMDPSYVFTVGYVCGMVTMLGIWLITEIRL
jgi:hypothetical protein